MAKSAKTPAGPSSPAGSGHAGGCPVGELFEMLGRPHMLDLLYVFSAGSAPIRFSELEDRLHIPPKTLSQRLRALVERGFLVRQAYSEIPPRVEYSPTRKLLDLLPIFDAINAWAKENTLTATPVVSVTGPVPPPRALA